MIVKCGIHAVEVFRLILIFFKRKGNFQHQRQDFDAIFKIEFGLVHCNTQPDQTKDEQYDKTSKLYFSTAESLENRFCVSHYIFIKKQVFTIY